MTGAKQRILVGVDGSEESLEAVRWAVDYARKVDGSLVAIKTWHYPWAMQTAPAQIDTEMKDQTRDELNQAIVKSGADTAGVDLTISVEEGHASQVLVRESAGADLLVLGSRGHTPFTGMLVGSVSLHCVHASQCPVVVVRKRA